MNIKVENLCFSYDDDVIYKNYNLDLRGPGLYALTGPNGSGKTTLMNLFVKKLSKDSGNIFVNNESIESENYPHISYIKGEEYLFEHLTVKETLDLFGLETKILNFYHLLEVMDQKCSTLSKGERTRLYLLIMIETSNDIILMDEVTANLDKKTEEKIFTRIKELSESKLIIYATNCKDTYKYADNIINILENNICFISDKEVDSTTKDFNIKIRNKCFDLKLSKLLGMICFLLFIVSNISISIYFIYKKENLFYNNANSSLDTVSLLSDKPNGYVFKYMEEQDFLGCAYNNSIFGKYYVSFLNEIDGYNIQKNEMIIGKKLYAELSSYYDARENGNSLNSFKGLSSWSISRVNSDFYFSSIYNNDIKIKILPYDIDSFNVFYINRETYNFILASLYEIMFEDMDMENPHLNAILSIPYSIDIKGMINTSIKMDSFIIDFSLSDKQIVTKIPFTYKNEKIYFNDAEIKNLQVIKSDVEYTRISMDLVIELMDHCETIYANKYASTIYVNSDNIDKTSKYLLDNQVFLYNESSENIHRIITYSDNLPNFYFACWMVLFIVCILIVFLNEYLFFKINNNSINLFKSMGLEKKQLYSFFIKKNMTNLLILFACLCSCGIFFIKGIKYDSINLLFIERPVSFYAMIIGVTIVFLIEKVIAEVVFINKK